MARYLCVEHDPEAFRRNLEKAGFLRPDAPLSTEEVVDHMAVFYDTVREPAAADHDRGLLLGGRAPVLRRAQPGHQLRGAFPRSYVILQRINLGLFGLLGELTATANWRAIAEEIWPFVRAPPSTPIGEAEGPWLARRSAAMPGAAAAW